LKVASLLDTFLKITGTCIVKHSLLTVVEVAAVPETVVETIVLQSESQSESQYSSVTTAKLLVN